MSNAISSQNNQSAEEITKVGEKYYFESLKDQIEKTNNGDFLVLEVESKKSFINKDLMIALNEARKKFPSKLFFIVQIGTLQKPTMNYKKENYGWLF